MVAAQKVLALGSGLCPGFHIRPMGVQNESFLVNLTLPELDMFSARGTCHCQL